ncbi:MAG: hypothetical protein IJ206_13050 [Oscillospiraceae bacterium]|nr:hypothetical protein [Oscillospiraceae bacterium]
MPINSRDKGARYEREVAGLLREYGYEASRTAQHCGKAGLAPDVVGLPGVHIECKHCERMALYDWMAQAVRDSAHSGSAPAVFHRRNHAETLVTMRLGDWMRLYNNSDWPDGNGGNANE